MGSPVFLDEDLLLHDVFSRFLKFNVLRYS
ncbi:hypothetical protein BN874_350004 [Candidatus Contendobacter odensis Run_B_J11]|uniref:Uncharacterized protein n=1 Tax=Candidatus Contendobacter odensis Run_B_J11 TaxID=1400861 RepID=A0A7U7J594_9GAMM|nr:hypothetical protein BN874_350004 [Candidatus Contendobacter odensis Run_B_J11]